MHVHGSMILLPLEVTMLCKYQGGWVGIIVYYG